ncbi:acyl-homoserine-lactone synthase [Halomonas sp. I5-271120]|uniref:acyl-homoserine-lactone synthase n=1 Tax=Halomonas sp. I5-271120 TaxID=3061632 RepID=UPI002714DFF7|nr:acyl-homoserine-lactone synthase [Halomonas sp. I5-271120]
MVTHSTIDLFGYSFHSKTYNFCKLDNKALEEIYQLRKESFIDRRKWDIKSYTGGDLERDEYDDEDSYYTCLYHNGQLAGCLRARPFYSTNMIAGCLNHMFPLVDLESYRSSLYWEASRFTITRKPKIISSNLDIRTVALFMAMLDFSCLAGFSHYLIVVDELMLRILRRAGWDCKILDVSFGSKGEKIYLGDLLSNGEVKERLQNKSKFMSADSKSTDLAC